MSAADGVEDFLRAGRESSSLLRAVALYEDLKRDAARIIPNILPQAQSTGRSTTLSPKTAYRAEFFKKCR
jgi:hypothetical protein